MINKNQIREYLADFQKRELPKLIRRDLRIKKANKIVTIIGPRRAGKTFFLFQLMEDLIKNGVNKEEIIYLNFEDPRLINLEASEIREIIKIHWESFSREKNYLFIDEPQNVENWELGVRSLYDEGFEIYLTGSSSKLLSKEIATSLRGRSLAYLLTPFSFKEYLRMKGEVPEIPKMSSKEKAKLIYLLNDFLDFGGFPEVIKENSKEEKLRILQSYFELVVFRDIVERYNIKNSKLIKWMIKSLISSFSNEVSINKMYLTLKSQNIKSSKNTLYTYFSLLEDSFFIFNLQKFSFSERKKEFSQSKVYLNDVGFVKLIESSRELGKKMENSVFLELNRRKKVLEDISYWKNSQQEEVDFVVSESKKVKKLIQVCYNTENQKTLDREIRSLLKAGKELKCKKLVIINKDLEKEKDFEWFGIKGRIKFIPLWKWMLETR